MSARKNSVDFLKTPAVVGTIHSPASLRCALRLAPGQVDLLELRVDEFADDPKPLLRAVRRLGAPLIVTVRHHAQGGSHRLSVARRRELYAAFLPFAACVDIELRSLPDLASTIATARHHGVALILSVHHFRSTPSSARLAAQLRLARTARADVFKLATLTSTLHGLMRLMQMFPRRGPPALSVMGMGEYGKISRLLLARAGSVLNYGYLDRAQLPGQWEATLLKARIAEINAVDGT